LYSFGYKIIKNNLILQIQFSAVLWQNDAQLVYKSDVVSLITPKKGSLVSCCTLFFGMKNADRSDVVISIGILDGGFS